jgi:hypothetical protein
VDLPTSESLRSIDEATGYQDARAKMRCKNMEAVHREGTAQMIIISLVDYYKQLFRLPAEDFQSCQKFKQATNLVGKITNDVVYDRLAPE